MSVAQSSILNYLASSKHLGRTVTLCVVYYQATNLFVPIIQNKDNDINIYFLCVNTLLAQQLLQLRRKKPFRPLT